MLFEILNKLVTFALTKKASFFVLIRLKCPLKAFKMAL